MWHLAKWWRCASFLPASVLGLAFMVGAGPKVASAATSAAPTARPAGPQLPPAANAKLVGDWCANTLVDGKQRGHWLRLAADGTWRRIEDYFGFRAENSGAWLADGAGAELENLGVGLHLQAEKLLLASRGQTLYAFERCPGLPQALRDLPSFPRTLSETVAILSAELAEPERIVIAGTLERDLPRFHHGLGTYIRNHFGLWGPNPALLAACKVEHPDDASDVILGALRRHLRDIRPAGRELDRLERLLVELTMAPVAVRRMTVAQFVASVNREIEKALSRKGQPKDAVVLELAPPKTDDERARRQGDLLSHPALLRAWGRRERVGDGVALWDLLPAFKRWLKAPARVMLEPDFDSRHFRAPEKSPDFASARWQGDWFEIETSFEQGTGPSDSVRIDAWTMLGDDPPMPVEQAGIRAGEAREHIRAGKRLTEIAVTGAPAGETWAWQYALRSSLDVPKGGSSALSSDETRALESLGIRSADLSSKSHWKDQRRPPRISATQALDLFRQLSAGKGLFAPTSVEMRLRRAGSSTLWFYQIVLRGPDASTTGLVTLDGRVLASREPVGAVPPGP